jgi:hypothetical protein
MPEPRSLPVEYFDSAHMPVGIGVKLYPGLAGGPRLGHIDDAGRAADPHRCDRRRDFHVSGARHFAGEESGSAARNRKQGGVAATALLIDEFVDGDARIGAQAEGRLVVEGDAESRAHPGLQRVVLENEVVDT